MERWSKDNHMRLNNIKAQDAAHDHQYKTTTTFESNIISNPQRRRPQAGGQIRVSGRIPQ